MMLKIPGYFWLFRSFSIFGNFLVHPELLNDHFFYYYVKIAEPVAEKAAEETSAEPAGVQNAAFEEAKTDEVEMSADF